MKVYVVIWHMDQSASQIQEIFKNYDDARAYINNSEYSYRLEIEEYELK